MLVLTRAQLLALRESCAGTATDTALWHACNSALWHVDRNGELRGYYTDAGDHVRAAATAMGLVSQ